LTTEERQIERAKIRLGSLEVLARYSEAIQNDRNTTQADFCRAAQMKTGTLSNTLRELEERLGFLLFEAKLQGEGGGCLRTTSSLHDVMEHKKKVVVSAKDNDPSNVDVHQKKKKKERTLATERTNRFTEAGKEIAAISMLLDVLLTMSRNHTPDHLVDFLSNLTDCLKRDHDAWIRANSSYYDDRDEPDDPYANGYFQDRPEGPVEEEDWEGPPDPPPADWRNSFRNVSKLSEPETGQ